jgi:AcrR family transcriptional regulator
VTTPPPTSLRERKKQKLRSQLIEVSQRLFAEQGFAATTLEQICAEVDVRPQTLLRYFESKAHLALAETFEVLEDLRTAVGDPDRDDRAIDIWRRAVLENATPHTVQLAKWVLVEPAVVALFATVQDQLEAVLAEGMAVDEGADPMDISCHVRAAALVGGSASAFRQLLRIGQMDRLAETQMAVIDWVESAGAVGHTGLGTEAQRSQM